MTLHGLGLLLGLFGAPAVLAAVGHRFRERGPTGRSAFWGGALGYLFGLLLTLVAVTVPPAAWSEACGVRCLAVHWSLTGAFLAGGLVGYLAGGYRLPET